MKVKRHKEICQELNDLYERKNADYGDSFAKAREDIPNYTLGKLYDKLQRFKTLSLGADQRVNDETIEDTLMDLANYAIMELIERRYPWSNEEEDKPMAKVQRPRWAENIERATEKKEGKAMLCQVCGKRYTTKNVCEECLRRVKQVPEEEKPMKVYIAGMISGDNNYREKFGYAAEVLDSLGYTVMNPAVLPWGFDHHEYLHINRAMIDVCDGVVFLPDWTQSKGAKIEMGYAISKGKALGHLVDVAIHDSVKKTGVRVVDVTWEETGF